MKRLLIVLMCIAALALISGLRVDAVEDIRSQIESANRRFEAAFAKGDAAGVAACYTADAQILPPGAEMSSGAEAIAAYWAQGMQPGTTFKLNTIEVEQHGETAIEVGHAEIVGAGGKVLDSAKYVVIWKRVGGAWKLHRDIWNSSVAPAH